MTRQISWLLRLEGLLLLAAAVSGYALLDGGWLFFALLFLAPDLSMAGYLRGPAVGATVYNAGHTYLAPAALLLHGWFGGSLLAAQLGLVWVAHIGVDRLLGFGLKRPTGFRDTHLDRGSGAA